MSAPWKTALVTGASSGLGRGLATWLTKRGVKVYAAARRLELLESLKAEAGELLVPIRLDVSNGAATFAAVEQLDADSGGLDLVIANAGVGAETRPKKVDWANVQQQLDVNVTGATATLTGALCGMVKRKRGHVVGISSLAGLIPLPNNATYCASKAYVAMFLDSLRVDLERYGVDVTCIHPGFVKTDMTAKNKPDEMPFLLELDDAVDRMGRALVRKSKTYAFPWQLSSLIGASGAMPMGVRNALLRKLR